jgi:glycogen debranching enzyme
VALDLVNQYPKLTQATLVRLAELQGVEKNIAREEEPGKIIHEARDPKSDTLARRLSQTQGWDWPYYGSVDSTVEFIRTLAAYCNSGHDRFEFLSSKYTGRDNATHTIADSFISAVDWMNQKMDSNKEGLLEFKRINKGGIENQAWKDSWDAYFHEDGKIANHHRGIASIEVQRVAYDALLDASEFYAKHFGRANEAKQLEERAKKLRRIIMEHFWTGEKGGFFVLGTDRGKGGSLRQLSIKTSNMGHILRSPTLLIDGESSGVNMRREAIIKQLFSPEMLGVSGIRTLATSEYRFRPGAYHNGSVWLWDTYLIAQGLDYHGYHGLAYELEKRIRKVIASTKQFPEFIRGDIGSTEPTLNTQIVDVWDEQNQRVNRVEQPPQEVQAWTVGAIVAMTARRHVLGHRAKHPSRRKFENEILKSMESSEQQI